MRIFKGDNLASQLESGQQKKSVITFVSNVQSLLKTSKTLSIPFLYQTFLLLIVYQKYV